MKISQAQQKCVQIVFTMLLVMTIALTNAHAFSQIVAFGDSLTDNDDLDGYGSSIASNGPKVWIDYVADAYGEDILLDMAYCGAQTGATYPHMLWQVNEYLTNYTVDDDTLYTLWAGTNDLGYVTELSEINTVAEAAAGNVGAAADQLAAAGAGHILINNLPDLGQTPGARDQGPTIQAVATAYTTAFNTYLAGEITTLRSTYPGAIFYFFDVYTKFNELLADPAAYGFDNVTDRLDEAGATTDVYFFWDYSHPTHDGHLLIAEYALAELDRIIYVDADASGGSGGGGGGCFISILMP